MGKTKEKEVGYYRIRSSLFWLLIVVLVTCSGIAFFKTELHEMWVKSRGREDISFADLASQLDETDQCLLCGNNERSLIGYYKEMGGIGIIVLNNWQILNFQLHDPTAEEDAVPADNGTANLYGNADGINYSGNSMPSMGMASIDLTLPDSYAVDTEFLQNNLCDKCLTKVADSLTCSKWRNEKKEAIPLCLVAFETQEIYPLQADHLGYSIGGYRVDIEHSEDGLSVRTFLLPEKQSTP